MRSTGSSRSATATKPIGEQVGAPRIEAFLEKIEPAARDALFRELLAIDVELRLERGEQPRRPGLSRPLPRPRPAIERTFQKTVGRRHADQPHPRPRLATRPSRAPAHRRRRTPLDAMTPATTRRSPDAAGPIHPHGHPGRRRLRHRLPGTRRRAESPGRHQGAQDRGHRRRAAARVAAQGGPARRRTCGIRRSCGCSISAPRAKSRSTSFSNTSADAP